MTSHAVFVSHASEDSAAAHRICAALRAAGVEVWFDQSELRGGDAWDQMIRRQIKACALFIPVISRNTQARTEGYFRLEWKLAVDRSHLMATNRAFLLPVVIDDTREEDPEVPDRFREVHWTRLPGGETSPAFVERVRRLVAPPDASRPITPVPQGTADKTPGVEAAAVAAPRHSGSWWITVAAAGVVALLALGYVALLHREPRTPAAPAANTARPPATATSRSIAVLPFANESGDPGQQYFSDGLSEDLITTLSQFPGLKVIGRTSSFHFRDSREDSRTIGEKLGVTHLLEGSVRRASDLVRVSAELINTSDGSTLWSERYDRPYRDLFALQDDITRSVASALRAKLLITAGARAQSERPVSGNLEAYNALLQGKFYADRSNEANIQKAIGYFTRATQLDPGYALAWSYLSRMWTALSQEFLADEAAKVAYENARKAADTALSLAPDLSAAHLARGSLSQSGDLDWRGAEAEYRRAVELAPDDDEARFRLGNLLASTGELDRAVELTRGALANDPLRARWHHWLGIYLLALGRLDEAQKSVERAIELQPGAAAYHATLAEIAIARGAADEALAAAKQEPAEIWRQWALALALQTAGDHAAADAALKKLIDEHADGSAYQVAEVYALRKDPDAMFQWLERAWETRDPGLGSLVFDHLLRPYRRDPRFGAFCQKVGLPAPAPQS